MIRKVILVTADGGLYQGGNRGDDEKWSESQYYEGEGNRML